MKPDPEVINLLRVAATIKEAMNNLSYREREVLMLLYGLDDGYTYTLEEVGRIFKVTRERVRSVRDKGLMKMRRLLPGLIGETKP